MDQSILFFFIKQRKYHKKKYIVAVENGTMEELSLHLLKESKKTGLLLWLENNKKKTITNRR
jgi:hypothetical protein